MPAMISLPHISLRTRPLLHEAWTYEKHMLRGLSQFAHSRSLMLVRTSSRPLLDIIVNQWWRPGRTTRNSWQLNGNCGSSTTREDRGSEVHPDPDGSPKSAADAIAYDKKSQKRVRQPSGEELSGGACKSDPGVLERRKRVGLNRPARHGSKETSSATTEYAEPGEGPLLDLDESRAEEEQEKNAS